MCLDGVGIDRHVHAVFFNLGMFFFLILAPAGIRMRTISSIGAGAPPFFSGGSAWCGPARSTAGRRGHWPS